MIQISVVMPVKNVGRFVADAVKSVLVQEGVELELIAVDDGSTDNTMDEVKRVADARLRIVQGPQQGVSLAYNAGLAEVRGAYFVICDGDDLMPQGRLARQLKFLSEHAEFSAVCGYFTSMSQDGEYIADLGRKPNAEEITGELQNGVTRTSYCTYMTRTELVRELGGFRTFFKTGEDIDLMLRMGERGRVWYEPENCYQYRLHNTSLTHTRSRATNQFYEETARFFQRQRLSGKADDLEQGRPPSPPVPGEGRILSASEQEQGHLLARAWAASGEKRHKEAWMLGLRACLRRPGNPDSWKSLATLALIAMGLKASPKIV